MIAIDIDGDDAIIFSSNKRRELGIDGDKNAPAFVVLFQTEGNRFAVFFIAWVIEESELPSQVAATDGSNNSVMTVGKANVGDREVLAKLGD